MLLNPHWYTELYLCHLFPIKPPYFKNTEEHWKKTILSFLSRCWSLCQHEDVLVCLPYSAALLPVLSVHLWEKFRKQQDMCWFYSMKLFQLTGSNLDIFYCDLIAIFICKDIISKVSRSGWHWVFNHQIPLMWNQIGIVL